MRIIKPKTLQNYWQQDKYAKAEQQLKAWIREVSDAEWLTPADIKASYSNASIINRDRVVFNICGNNYRLVVSVRYDVKLVYIRYFGTHKEYENIDVSKI